MAEKCDWNPYENGPAMVGGVSCPNDATLSVGANGEWHLCPSCAELPAFKKYRRRKSLQSKEPHHADR